MSTSDTYTSKIALIVALGGFLMGFDASVISGVNKFVQIDFNLSDLQLGFSVSSLTIVAALAMAFSGPLSDRYGRKLMLKYCAVVFAISAIGSSLATSFIPFLIFRMLGGIGVGASLILAPMYIAEIAPAESRGRLVSFNQLNIVVGITAAFFSNYYILSLGDSTASWVHTLGFSQHNWRWMLGVEALPALMYFFGLSIVPRSPRWLMIKDRESEALEVLKRFSKEENAAEDLQSIKASLSNEQSEKQASYLEIFKPAMRLVLIIGIVVSVLQQITGINAVFFYAPMIFEQSGIGINASFIQAVLVGLTNVVFTVIAMALIDRVGRKPLLVAGVGGIVLFMGLLAYGFNEASYTLQEEQLELLSEDIRSQIAPLVGQEFDGDVSYKEALKQTLGTAQAKIHEGALISAAISMNPRLILVGILGFVACFAVSLGPVMWVLFSELFPLKVRGVAISFVGFINSGVSALVQFIFPWELSTLGSATTFLIYGVFAAIGLLMVLKFVPETKGRSLEALEADLVGES